MKYLSGSSKLGHVVFFCCVDLIGRFAFKETEVLPMDVFCFFLSFYLNGPYFRNVYLTLLPHLVCCLMKRVQCLLPHLLRNERYIKMCSALCAVILREYDF